MSTLVAEAHIRDSHWLERLIRKPSFWIIFWIVGFSYPLVRSMNRDLPDPLPTFYTVPEFKMVNEFGKPFGSEQLKGKIYIANFAFTSCTTVCPPLMEKIQKVQKRIRGLRGAVSLVTFSVDPKTDTPKVLFKYSRKLQTNPLLWTFLTGEEQEMKSLLIDGFKVPMGSKEKAKHLYDIAHSQRLVLVDREGSIRGYYSTDKASIDKLMIDTGLLANNSFNTKE